MENIKKTLLSFLGDASGNVLFEQLMSGSVGALITKAIDSPLTTLILLPLLAVLYHISKNNGDDDSAKKIEQRFSELRNALQKELSSIKHHEQSILEHSLETELTLKKFKEQAIAIIEDNSLGIGELAEKLEITQEEYKLFSSHLTSLLEDIKTIQETVLESNAILHRDEDILEGIQKDLRTIVEAQTNREHIAQGDIFQSRFIACTSVIETVVTNLDTKADAAIQSILNDIAQGNIANAMKKYEVLANEKEYSDKILTRLWAKVVHARIDLAKGDIEDGQKQIEDLLTTAKALSVSIENPVWLLTIARYWILENKHDMAKELLLSILKGEHKGFRMEAKALLFSIEDIKAEEMHQKLSADELDDCTILEVLAKKCFAEADYGKALEYARKSYETAKTRQIVPCYLTLIAAYYGQRFKSNKITFGFSRNYIDKKDWGEYHEINKVLSGLLYYAERINSPVLQSIAYYKLAILHFVCNENEDLKYAFSRFFEQRVVAADLIEGMASMMCAVGQSDCVIDKLKKMQERLPREALLLLGQLLARKADDAFSEGERILLQLLNDKGADSDLRGISAISLIDSYRNKLQKNKLQELVGIFPSDENSDAMNTVRRILDLELMEEPKDGKALFEAIVVQCPDGLKNQPDFLRFIRPLALRFKAYEVLAALLKPYLAYSEKSHCDRDYFDLMLQARNVQAIADFNNSLLDNGCFDADFIQRELDLVAKISLRKARTRVFDILAYPLPERLRKTVNVWRDMIQAECGDLSSSDDAANDYPTIDEIRNEKNHVPWINIPMLLLRRGCPKEAFAFSYALCHVFTGEEDVRKNYLALFLMDSRRNFVFPKPEVVSAGTAVTLEKDDGKGEQCIYIEDSDWLQNSWNEYPSSSAFGRCLCGLRCGDEVKLAELDIHNWKVKDISSKYQRRYIEWLNKEAQTPRSGITMFTTPEKADGGMDFSELVLHLRNIRDSRERAIQSGCEFYRTVAPAFGLFKGATRLTFQQAFACLPCFSDLYVKTALGTAEERFLSLSMLRQDKRIVLTKLTVELLIFLEFQTGIDVMARLEASKLKIVASEYLLDYLHNEKRQPTSAETIALDGDHPRMYHDNYGLERTRLLSRYFVFLNKSDCILGNILSNEDGDEEDFNIRAVLGRDYYHALMIATADANTMLWDDDATTMYICQHYDGKLKVRNRVFTQVVFKHLHNLGVISDKEQTSVNIFLLKMKMRFTWCDSDTIVELAVTQKAPLNPAFREFCWYLNRDNTELDVESVRRVCFNSIRKLAESQDYPRKAQKAGMKTLVRAFAQYDRKLLGDCLFNGLKTALENKSNTIHGYVVKRLHAYLSRSHRKLLRAMMRRSLAQRKPARNAKSSMRKHRHR